MAEHYNIKTRNIIKILYIQNDMSSEKIAELFDNTPSAKTIQRWALERNEDGENWNDIRQKRLHAVAETFTREELINTVWTDIYNLVSIKDMDPTKRADALSKLQKFVDKLDDPRAKINTMLEFLEDFAGYTAREYREFMAQHGETFSTIVRSYRKERLQRFAK